MKEVPGISDGAIFLGKVLMEAFSRRPDYKTRYFNWRLEGLSGLAELLGRDEKELNHRRNIGPKTRELLRMIRKVAFEWIGESIKK